MPCLPIRKKVVKPVQTMPDKNVNRYGETQIRYVGCRLPQGELRKGLPHDPNSGRALPEVPREELKPEIPVKTHQLQLQTRSERQEHNQLDTSLVSSKPPSYRASKPIPLTLDFYVSVPIFNETLNHSYRKKNEYVYLDRPDDEASLFHQSLSRGSSLRDLRSSGKSSHSHYETRETSGKRRPLPQERPVSRNVVRRPMSGSEASYNTMSSRGTYGYESETLERAVPLKNRHVRSGICLDSDEEDCR